MKITQVFWYILIFGILVLFYNCAGNDETMENIIPDPKSQLAAMPFEKLSDYSFFEGNLADLIPKENVIPYIINTPLFSNYAKKARFIWMPENKAAEYNDTEVFDFPIGTIIVKNFYYDNDFQQPENGRKIIETRLLIQQDTGWMSVPYLWKDDQSEADLHIVGRQLQINWIHFDGSERTANYSVPNSVECLGCHNVNNNLLPIGPKARNLNSVLSYPDGSSMNQLDKWVEIGYLKNAPSSSQAPKVPVFDDPNDGNINERARAYLDINCGHCHNPDGPANNSGLSLYFHEQNPTAIGICKPPVAAGQGAGGFEYSIVPGQPDSSIMAFRMNSVELEIAMPELSRSVIHTEGVELIRDWISTLDGDCN